MKTIKDANCNMDTVLPWAVSAKNTLPNHDGYYLLDMFALSNYI